MNCTRVLGLLSFLAVLGCKPTGKPNVEEEKISKGSENTVSGDDLKKAAGQYLEETKGQTDTDPQLDRLATGITQGNLTSQDLDTAANDPFVQAQTMRAQIDYLDEALTERAVEIIFSTNGESTNNSAQGLVADGEGASSGYSSTFLLAAAGIAFVGGALMFKGSGGGTSAPPASDPESSQRVKAELDLLNAERAALKKTSTQMDSPDQRERISAATQHTESKMKPSMAESKVDLEKALDDLGRVNYEHEPWALRKQLPYFESKAPITEVKETLKELGKQWSGRPGLTWLKTNEDVFHKFLVGIPASHLAVLEGEDKLKDIVGKIRAYQKLVAQTPFVGEPENVEGFKALRTEVRGSIDIKLSAATITPFSEIPALLEAKYKWAENITKLDALAEKVKLPFNETGNKYVSALIVSRVLASDDPVRISETDLKNFGFTDQEISRYMAHFNTTEFQASVEAIRAESKPLKQALLAENKDILDSTKATVAYSEKLRMLATMERIVKKSSSSLKQEMLSEIQKQKIDLEHTVEKNLVPDHARLEISERILKPDKIKFDGIKSLSIRNVLVNNIKPRLRLTDSEERISESITLQASGAFLQAIIKALPSTLANP